MILGVGVDLVEVSRMERILERPWGRRFVERVFCKEEIAVCQGSARPAEAYAARFAAKEALVKALGTGFSKGVTPAAVLICGGERTQPSIRLRAEASVMAEAMNVSGIHVSLTHTAETACAMVVVEKK
ncbi:MAG TPA: holo-ACP synthase [Desulfomonilaceae bacterium]|nr:holo-ACP synthase [Desulfomonilaceae bacterium]